MGRQGRRTLRLFFVVMVVFGITTTLHGLSALATYGLGAVSFLLLAGFAFLVPAGMAASELATTWSRDGGVFVWVGEAFGDGAGFLAAWLQWLQDVIFWTVIFTGSAAMLALGFGWTNGIGDKPYTVAVVVGAIWLTTLLTVRGLGATGWVGTVGSLAGTIVPGVALVGFAIAFLAQGHPSHTPLELGALVPDLATPGDLAFAISTIMVFAGIELMGTRVQEIDDPARTYPRATFTAIGLALLVLIPTVVAIAVLVPASELSITAGIVQATTTVFDGTWGLSWVPAVFAVALLLDALGEIAGWMAGTPVAMATAAAHGFLPARFARVEGQAARPVLLAQGAIGSLISTAFIFVPTVASAFWVLAALLVQLYLLMYLLLFAAVWRLRSTQPDRPRPWRIPGGRPGIAAVCGVGSTCCAAAFAIGFIPPSSLAVSTSTYLLVLGSGLAISLLVPTLLIARWHLTARRHPRAAVPRRRART
jgi:amino acid transporter